MNANNDIEPTADEQAGNMPCTSALDERLDDFEYGLSCDVFSPEEEIEMYEQYLKLTGQSTAGRIAAGGMAAVDAITNLMAG